MSLNGEQFLELFGTRSGRWLANRLNLRGAGSERLANLLSCWAWNSRAAVALDGIRVMKGQDRRQNAYADYCALLRREIESHQLYERIRKQIAFW